MELFIIALGLITAVVWAAYHLWHPEPWKQNTSHPRLVFRPAPYDPDIYTRDTIPCDMRPFLQEDPEWISAAERVNSRAPAGPPS